MSMDNQKSLSPIRLVLYAGSVFAFIFMMYFVTHSFYNLFNQAVNGLQVFWEIVPLILSSFVSILVFSSILFVALFSHTRKSRARDSLIYGLVLLVIGLIILVYSCVLMLTYGSIFEGIKTPLYPLDSFAYSFVALIIATYYIYYYFRNTSLPETEFFTRRLTKKARVGFIFYSIITAYFTTMLFFIFFYTSDLAWNRDPYGIILTMLLFALPLIGLILYIIVRNQRNSNLRRLLHLVFASSYTVFSILVFILININALPGSNPYLYAIDLHFLFPVGYSIRITAEIYILFGMAVLSGVISLLMFLRHVMKERKTTRTV